MHRNLKNPRKFVTVVASNIIKRRNGEISNGVEADAGVSTGRMPEPLVEPCWAIGADASGVSGSSSGVISYGAGAGANADVSEPENILSFL